ncbi:AraC family transcriptional regulator [Actinomycetes bacterium KLBMP 9759]
MRSIASDGAAGSRIQDAVTSGGQRPRLVFASSDVDEVCAGLNSYMEPGSVRVTPRSAAGGEYRLYSVYPEPFAVSAHGLSLYQVEVDLDLDLHANQVGDAYTIDFTRSGLHDKVIDGNRGTTSRTISGPGQNVRSRLSGSRFSVLRIGRSALEDAARGRSGDDARGRLAFEPSLRAADPAAIAWLRLVATLESPPMVAMLAQSRLAAAHFEQLVVHGLLDILPSIPSIAHDRGRLDGRALRRAVEFCEVNASEPITVTDIAAAANTAVRTVQRAFRAELGMSPMDYLKQVRLERVRRELVLIRRGHLDRTITEVAMKWGFVHLGRFSTTYRNRFGERPSETIRR